MSYFSQRDEMTQRAIIHNDEMERLFSNYTKYSIENTKIYDPSNSHVCRDPLTSDVKIYFSNSNSMDCINIDLHDLSHNENWKKVALLNFASYKNPGGMYMEGSSAQEESICHGTNLYQVIKEFPDYYKHNKKNLMRGLYTSRALYSPKIITDWENDKPTAFTNVITCAAPNKRAFLRNALRDDNKDEVMKINNLAVYDRVKFIIDICDINQIEYLIAGAYGTGVFCQDVAVVADAFKKAIETSTSLKAVWFPLMNDGEKYFIMNSILDKAVKRLTRRE